MKTFIASALLILIIGNIEAADIETYQFIDHLRGIVEPRSPEVVGNAVIFTASSTYQRVGVSFAYEGFSQVHWFQQLMLPRDNAELIKDGKKIKNIAPYVDSGILFHVHAIPEGVSHLDYRLVINGLWTADPLNPLTVTGTAGIVQSRVALPAQIQAALAAAQQTGSFQFTFRGTPGETVTVAGSFNNWDPFMFPLREVRPGVFTLMLPLPPGRFQYAFVYQGQQIPDPANLRLLYTHYRGVVSEAIIY
ncbi:MAG: isoamylase [Treponema sp.]|nr:isoamylase [Treponema sp.]